MLIRTSPWLIGALAALALAQPNRAPAAENTAAAAAPAAAPKPGEVLHSMSEYLAKAKAFSYHAEVEFDQVLPGGPKIRLSGAVDIAAARPGSLFVDYRDDVSDRVAWLEKGLFTFFDPVAGIYAQVSGAEDIDGMIAELEKRQGLTLPLGELVESNPEEALSRGVKTAFYVGVHNVEGIYCHHIVLQREDLDLQIFVEVGDKPLPRKIVFEYPDKLGSPQYTASITEWSFDPPKAEIFVAKVPKGAAKVEFLNIGEGR